MLIVPVPCAAMGYQLTRIVGHASQVPHVISITYLGAPKEAQICLKQTDSSINSLWPSVRCMWTSCSWKVRHDACFQAKSKENDSIWATRTSCFRLETIQMSQL